MSNLLKFLEEPIINIFIKLLLVVYIVLIVPKLPNPVIYTFSNVFFRFVMLVFTVWITGKDPALGLLMTLAYISSMVSLSGKSLFEIIEQAHLATYASYEENVNEDAENLENGGTEQSDIVPMYPEPMTASERPPQIPQADTMPFDNVNNFDDFAPDAMDTSNFTGMAMY